MESIACPLGYYVAVIVLSVFITAYKLRTDEEFRRDQRAQVEPILECVQAGTRHVLEAVRTRLSRPEAGRPVVVPAAVAEARKEV